MPGNGVGDRDNHFFGQESLSQGHSRLDVVDRTWPGLSNNLLVGSQRQSGFPFIPDLKNYSVQQSDIDARHGSPFHIPHGLSFAQTNMQPELSGSQFHSLQTSLNGYIQGHQFFPAAQNEANLLGMDTESDQHNLGSKGYPILDSQRVRGRDLHRHDPVKSMNAEAPVSFNFSSRQEQMGGQHPSAMQSFHGQQSSISDMQLLQQQLMLKQLQDVRRQMLQQQENWKKNSASQLSVMAKPALASHPSMQLNGIPVNDVSSYSWQSGLTENTSWVPRGASPVLQGSSGSLILSPEQVQGPHVMGLVPQQVNQSIYEVSHSGSKEDLSQISQMEIDDIAMQQIASNVHSLPGSLCSSLPDHGSVQDGHLVSKQFEDVGHGLCSGFNLGNSQQVNSPHGNVSVEEFDGSQEFAHLSEAPQGKTSSSVASSQSVGTLDPTEERILFGADDSVWGAFGGGTNVVAGNYSMCDGSGSLSGFPSVQSGSWSALMQSALAETSSDNQIVQEEWSGLSVQSAQPSISNQKPLSENESARQQLAWGDDTLQTSLLSSRSVQLANNVVRSGGFPSVSVFQQSDLRALHGQSENVKTASSGRSEILQADSPRTIHDFSDGNRWLERSHLQRNSSEGSQICGTIADSSDAEGKRIMGGSWTVQQSMSSSIPGDQQNNRSGWNVIEPAMPGHHAVSNDYSRNALLSFQNVSPNRSLHEQVSHGVAVSNADSVPTDGLEHAEPIDRQNSSTSNAAMMTLNTRRSQGESIQPLAKSHGFNFWRTVDSSMNTQRTEVQGSNCNSLDKSVQTMQSLAINRMYERENLNGKDNLASGFHLNASLHRSTDIFQEHEWSNADEFGNLRERKQNAFGECAQKPTGIHKFQYHPMGNLNVDMESPRGVNQVSLSRAMPQQVSGAIRSPGQGLSASSNITAQTDKSNAGMEKVDLKGTEATLPGMLVASNNLSSLRRSLVSSSSNENAQSSQKMLEHLHKVDQLREHGASSHLSSSDLNETNEAENSDGSISHVQRNQYPQTTSSWFEQYRTLKNGQVLQVYDARQMANVKAMQQAVIAQKPADGLQHPNFVAQAHSAFPAGPLSNACSTTTPASEHMSLHHSLRPDAMPPKLLVKPKKRKSTMSGPLAWHKEVAEGARRLHELSMAEEEWATATNMLVEKVDHESDPHETVLPAHRPKRRLLSTTQLMQLLFQPPPAAFLTADSSSHFEDIAYFAGRLTLGNACSIISCPNSEKTLSRLPEVSDRTDDTSLLKSVDELVGRIKNLETELSRLGKRFSIIDLRVECQDLERFSVINRFAKFHCRGQATNGTGTSSSDSGAGNQKVFIQRYVAALPVPKNLPDRVQCLPL